MGKEKLPLDIKVIKHLMMVFGIMALCMAKEYFYGWMAPNTKDNLLMAKNKDKELFIFLMEITIEVIGLEESSRGLVFYLINITKSLKKEFGRMVFFRHLWYNKNGNSKVN